jgi:hypothetical protein
LPAPPGPNDTRRAGGGTMRDLMSETATPPPAAPPPPASPLGSGTATAAPRRQPPRPGDVVSVRGQRVRVTRVLPNGQIEGVRVP